MRKVVALVFLLLTSLFVLPPSLAKAQVRRPALVLSPSTTITAGSHKTIQLSMVNMGVVLKRVEIAVRFSGDMDQQWGQSFKQLNTQQYGLEYKSHYFTPVVGPPGTQDMIIVFEAMQPQGYNQGSAQIPLVEVSYLSVPGTYTAMVVPEKTYITDINGNLLSGIDVFGTYNYRAEGQLRPTTGPDIETYSVSFESDPVRKWWPTAPNSVQQIDAALYKDSDGTGVKNFSNISAEWQVDPSFIEIRNTSSSYFDKCVVPMADNRPCIRFYAHVITKKPGQSTISLRVTDHTTGKQAWNSYPLEIYTIQDPPIVAPTPQSSVVPRTPTPAPTFIPERQVSTKELEAVQQKVTYLQSQLDQQQKQITETQSLLQRVVSALRRFLRI